MIISSDPATGAVVERFAPFSRAQVEAAVAQVAQAQSDWKVRSFEERAVPLRRAADILRERRAAYAALLVQEMGKPFAEAEAEVEKSAGACDHYADEAARILADQAVTLGTSVNHVRFAPLGVILAVMPWNFPFWQVFRAAAPILMAGNGLLLKHASNVPRSALAIEALLLEAGLPDGLFRTLLIEGGEVVEELLADERVAGLTLTGSSAVGARLASIAGRTLKRQVLELGGSDPFIVLADADLAHTARAASRARNQNNGQSCIAAKRFIVNESVADEFGALLAEAVGSLVVGDPLDRTTQVGPLARPDLVDELERQVEGSVRMGARILVGGTRVPGAGSFYAPTVLDFVTPDMPAFVEETFGPVAAIIRARDTDHAVELANDSRYGLGASIWTRDLVAADDLANRIDSGLVFINGIVASDVHLPMGGIKASGYGRELGAFGLVEFSNVRTIRAWPAGSHPV